MTTTSDDGLLDELACRRLQERYWRALSEHDADGVAGVFTDDGRWGATTGRDSIRDAATDLFTSLDSLLHMSTHIGSIKIEIQDDLGTGAIEGIAHHVIREDDHDRIVVANALYYLTYRRVQDGWRIVSMSGRSDTHALHDATFQYNVTMAAIDYGIPA